MLGRMRVIVRWLLLAAALLLVANLYRGVRIADFETAMFAALVIGLFNAAVRPVRQILECHMLGGGFDYLLKIRVRDMTEYREILGGVIGALPMVESTHSYFVMEQVKESPLLPIPRPKDRKP